MRLAVISDLHANLQAVNSVLEDIKNQEIDKIICLGDCVDYGPQPNEVVSLLIDKKIPTILGNHEMAFINPEFLSTFSENAYVSHFVTKRIIKNDILDYLISLPINLISDDLFFVHGIPPDSAFTYINMLDYDEMIDSFNNFTQQIAFVGHTHKTAVYELFEKQLKINDLTNQIIKLDQNNRYLINVGSVGQPRDSDGNKKSKYIIFDNSALTVENRYIDYDVATTVSLIREVGMPGRNALRLI